MTPLTIVKKLESLIERILNDTENILQGNKMKNKKIGLSANLVKNIKRKIATKNRDLAVTLELRSGELGEFPYGYFKYSKEDMYGVELEITKSDEKQKIVDVAGKFASTSYGVQSIHYKVIKGNNVDYATCFIDFIDGYANKEDFLKSISFLSNIPNDFIEKLKSDICSEVSIDFPIY